MCHDTGSTPESIIPPKYNFSQLLHSYGTSLEYAPNKANFYVLCSQLASGLEKRTLNELLTFTIFKALMWETVNDKNCALQLFISIGMVYNKVHGSSTVHSGAAINLATTTCKIAFLQVEPNLLAKMGNGNDPKLGRPTKHPRLQTVNICQCTNRI